jgi:murein DD-endopeptidase MepM/ murein hydrolase activator NlpD
MKLNRLKTTDPVQRGGPLKLSGIFGLGRGAKWPIKHRRIVLLVLSGLVVILVSVELLNLQTPHGLEPAARKVDSVSAPTTRDEKGNRSKDAPAAPARETAPSIAEASNVTDSDVDYLASRNLLIPLKGISASQLHDTFKESRSEGRQHDALDVKAPQGTPVLATTDGVVTKLFQSERGGITLYQLDPSGRYVYYYAHLMRYEDGIAEGKQLRRGDVIAYVGDTGNAGAGNYHLHFAISKITAPGKWSGGDPINPYPLLVKH